MCRHTGTDILDAATIRYLAMERGSVPSPCGLTSTQRSMAAVYSMASKLSPRHTAPLVEEVGGLRVELRYTTDAKEAEYALGGGNTTDYV